MGSTSASRCSVLAIRPYSAKAWIEYVARQVGVSATDFAFYEWSGRTIEFHRGQIRRALSMLPCAGTRGKRREMRVASSASLSSGLPVMRARPSSAGDGEPVAAGVPPGQSAGEPGVSAS
jgi:hypothetical protein